MTFEQFIGLGMLLAVVALVFLVAYIALTWRKPRNETGSGILERLRHEPALLSGFVGAAVALGASFGLELTSEQVGAIMAVLSAGLAVLVRQRVSPVSKTD